MHQFVIALNTFTYEVLVILTNFPNSLLGLFI